MKSCFQQQTLGTYHGKTKEREEFGWYNFLLQLLSSSGDVEAGITHNQLHRYPHQSMGKTQIGVKKKHTHTQRAQHSVVITRNPNFID